MPTTQNAILALLAVLAVALMAMAKADASQCPDAADIPADVRADIAVGAARIPGCVMAEDGTLVPSSFYSGAGTYRAA
jgi:hypothetical protein